MKYNFLAPLMSLLTKISSQFIENSCPLSDLITMFMKGRLSRENICCVTPTPDLLIGQRAGFYTIFSQTCLGIIVN